MFHITNNAMVNIGPSGTWHPPSTSRVVYSSDDEDDDEVERPTVGRRHHVISAAHSAKQDTKQLTPALTNKNMMKNLIV